MTGDQAAMVCSFLISSGGGLGYGEADICGVSFLRSDFIVDVIYSGHGIRIRCEDIHRFEMMDGLRISDSPNRFGELFTQHLNEEIDTGLLSHAVPQIGGVDQVTITPED